MIIYLNGAINSGKTTIGQLVVKGLPRGVHIELDDLPHPPSLTLHEAIPLILEDASLLTRSWVDRGFDPVLCWPISSEDHQRLLEKLRGLDQPVHTYTLSPRLDVALSDRSNRKLTPWEQERIRFHYTSGIAHPPFGIVIDNSDVSPELVAARILRDVRCCAQAM